MTENSKIDTLIPKKQRRARHMDCPLDLFTSEPVEGVVHFGGESISTWILPGKALMDPPESRSLHLMSEAIRLTVKYHLKALPTPSFQYIRF